MHTAHHFHCTDARVRFRFTYKSIFLLTFLLYCVCSAEYTYAQGQSKPAAARLPGCELPPISVPQLPETIPGYTELDPATNLHMTGTPQEIDLQGYTLEITGEVSRPVSLTYDDLRCLPKIESRPTLVCVGFFEDTATWAGASLQDVLSLAEPKEGATHIKLVSADGYATVLSLEEASKSENYLAYEWEGEPIPVLHGFPVRAVFPQMNGNRWVKWLIAIEVQ